MELKETPWAVFMGFTQSRPIEDADKASLLHRVAVRHPGRRYVKCFEHYLLSLKAENGGKISWPRKLFGFSIISLLLLQQRRTDFSAFWKIASISLLASKVKEVSTSQQIWEG